jgi:hypothetical protein
MQRRDIYKASKALSIQTEIDANLIAAERNEVFFRICFMLVLLLVKNPWRSFQQGNQKRSTQPVSPCLNCIPSTHRPHIHQSSM